MKVSIFLLASLAIVAAGCNDKSGSSGQSTNTSAVSEVVNAPADYVGGLAKAKQNAAKTADVSSITQAIRMFQVDKGRYPKDLNELVQENYLKQIPAAPYGTKLDYDPSTGEVKVVSQ